MVAIIMDNNNIKYIEFDANSNVPILSKESYNIILLPSFLKKDIEEEIGKVNEKTVIYVRKIGEQFELSRIFKFMGWFENKQDLNDTDEPNNLVILSPVDKIVYTFVTIRVFNINT
jgi:hypothetical protein